MDHRELTMVKNAVHNPAEPRHYMKLKPVNRLVRISCGDVVLAQTTSAVHLLEVGRDLYDPVFYLPVADLVADLVPIAEKSTHCPLKGDASYFAISVGAARSGDYVAWAYPEPFEFAAALADLIAFDGAKLRIEIIGDGSV